MKRIAIVLALSAALAVPSVAGADTIRQTGQIVGDKATTVKLRVKTNRRDRATKVSGFKAKNVRVRCKNGPRRISFSALQPIKVNHNEFRANLSDGEGGVLYIRGKVRGGGDSTRGSLRTNRFKTSNGRMCKAPKQRFRTSAR